MRYIANSSGYLQEVSFGAEITCGGQSCTEYTGSVPEGHATLEAWYIAECETLYRWKIADGELVKDISVAEPVENDLYVGASARLRTTADDRGNLQLFKADGTLAVNAYANGTSGGEIDLHDASGDAKAHLYVDTSGEGKLKLKDSSGGDHLLTPELIDQIGSGSGSGAVESVNDKTGAVVIGAEVVDGEAITPSAVNVGDAAQLSETDDGRGVMTLKRADGTEGIKAYALNSGAEIDMNDASGTTRAALYVSSDGDGKLKLTDSAGNSYTLTPALVQKLIDGLSAEEIADALANKSDSSHTHDDRYYTETETNSLLSSYALKADIARTATYGISNSATQYMKVSDFGNWGTGAWYQKGFSMLLTSRAGETVWVSVSSDDSGTNAKAFRIMNTYTKINGIWYSASESAIYCQMIAWCNNLNAHILSNVNGDYVPVISTASALPSDAKSINIVEFGVTSSGTQVGDTSVNLLLGGAADRPTYNSNAMALLSDVPATSSVAKLSETSDSRGVLTLKRADGTEALKAYALNSGAEIDMNDASGTTRAALYVSSEGDGKLKLTDSAGNSYTLTPALVQKLIDGLSASEIADALANKSDSSHTHAAATTSAAGFMSAADKSKLDGITASADAVSFSRSLTSGTKVGTLTINGTATDLYAPTNTDTTYSAATSSKLGLVKSGTDITVDSSGNVSVNDDSHNHVISNVDGLQTSLNDKASVSAANTYNGEQKFLHSQYCPNDNDIAYGVGAAYKASRGVVTQEIVGQIIMPNTAAADSYGCATDANIIKFQKITGTSAGIPTLETFASLTEEGFNASNFTVGLSSTLSETSDSRGVLTLKNSAYDSIESLKAYANTDGSGGLMTRNSSGNQAVTLSGSVSEMQSKAGGVVTYDANGESRTLLGTNTDDDGILRLKDSSGTAHILTPAMIDQIGSGGVTITKLWENASPTSEFAAQTIALDLSECDWVLVMAAPQTEYQWIISQICPVGMTGLLTYGWGDTKLPGHRDFTVSTTKIDFNSAYYNAKITTNQIIPVLIFGIKGVT